MSSIFYLHEDEWGMIELLPIENMAGRKEVAQEARQFGNEHRAGVGWTDMYVIPEEEHSIAERQIPLAELRDLVGSWLPEADEVQSGYGTTRESLPNSFAFGNNLLRSGAFYGSYNGDTITDLNILAPIKGDAGVVARFAEALATLSERHSLLLADWWSGLIVDLRDKGAAMNYLRGDEDEDETEDSEAPI